MADLHMILQKSNASDLVMPSKLTTILAVGGACIVTAPKGTSLYEVIEKHNLGYIVEPENTLLLVNKISEIKLDDKLEQKRNQARKYAVENLNIDNIMNNFVNDFVNY
jgi:colanic acid biosynthesis glycosyl transferase WcaI